MRRATVVSLALVALAAGVGAWFASRGELPTSPESARTADSAGPPSSSDLAAPPGSNRRDAPGAAKRGPGKAGAAANGVADRTAQPDRVEVVAADDRRPVAGADVSVRRESWTAAPEAVVTTGADGVVRFPHTDLHGTLVRVVAEGFVIHWEQINFFADESHVSRVKLERGVSLDGRVVDAASGVPIAGATLLVGRGRPGEPDDDEFGPTDADGRFHLPGVPDAHETTLRARAAGYAEGRMNVRVSDGKIRPERVVLRLEASGTLAGKVLSPDGEPVRGATVLAVPAAAWSFRRVRDVTSEAAEDPEVVSARHRDHAWPLSREADATTRTVSAEDGSFRVEGLARGVDYVLRATAAGFAASVPVDGLRLDARTPEARKDLRLRRAAVVRFSVLVPDGVARPPGVGVEWIGGDARLRTVESEVERFHLADVDPGDYLVIAGAGGFLVSTRSVRVTEGATVDVPLALTPGAAVGGVVVDEKGKPIPGASLRLAPVSGTLNASDPSRLGGQRYQMTDAKGRFSDTTLPPGPALLDAWAYASGGPLGLRSRVRLVAPAADLRVVLVAVGGTLRMRLLAPDRTPWTGEIWSRTSRNRSRDEWSYRSKPPDGMLVDSPYDVLYEDGSYPVSIDVAGFAPVTRSVEIRGGQTVDLGDVVLDVGVDILGKVVDSAGRPVASADVDVLDAKDRDTRTDDAGAYVLRHAPRGPYALRVSAKDYLAEEIEADGSKPGIVETTLMRPAIVRIALRDAAGAPAPKTLVRFRPAPAAPSSPETRRVTDPDGRGEVRVRPDRYDAIWTDSRGVERVLGTWTFAEGETRELDLTLPAK